MTQSVSSGEVSEFVALLSDLEREAGALAAQVPGREEGAATVRSVAADLIRRAQAGGLGGSPGALPLSRPFGEWDYGAAGQAVGDRIDAVNAFWRTRLARGDFEVAR